MYYIKYYFFLILFTHFVLLDIHSSANFSQTPEESAMREEPKKIPSTFKLLKSISLGLLVAGGTRYVSKKYFSHPLSLSTSLVKKIFSPANTLGLSFGVATFFASWYWLSENDNFQPNFKFGVGKNDKKNILIFSATKEIDAVFECYKKDSTFFRQAIGLSIPEIKIDFLNYQEIKNVTNYFIKKSEIFISFYVDKIKNEEFIEEITKPKGNNILYLLTKFSEKYRPQSIDPITSQSHLYLLQIAETNDTSGIEADAISKEKIFHITKEKLLERNIARHIDIHTQILLAPGSSNTRIGADSTSYTIEEEKVNIPK